MRAFGLSAALVACAARYFPQNPVDARTALALVPDASDLLRRLLDGGHSTVAGRLAAAFRGIGRERIANEIVDTMRTAGFTVRECDPFAAPAPALSFRRDLSHPDGNGRIGRCLMNVMLTAAGWPWTVIPVERREEYIAALEAVSVRQEIGPFAGFLGGLVGGRGPGPVAGG